MRFAGRAVLLRGAAWLAVAFPPAAFAAKHQPPPQWALDAAKTPTPAYAGDAAAVLLRDEYVITVDDQNQAVEREQYAVRILKPQGRGYGHCSIDYDTDEKLESFNAWTIAADGRQFQAMDSDFDDRGAYSAPILQFTERFRELDPPGDDPGAVVACETEKHLRPYFNSEYWQIQYPIPVVEEALELQLPPGGHYADSWSRIEPVKPVEMGPERLRWEIHNEPALDLENIRATPPWGALAARMEIKWGDQAVRGVDNQWRAIGEWMDRLDAGRADPTPEITAQAQALVSGASDFYTRLSRITEYIQENIRYFIVIRGIGGWQPHAAAEIFRNRYGDCKDKTTLLIAMLRAVGIPAYYLHVDSERGIIDPRAPSLVGDHMITAIELPAGENDPRLMARVKTASGKTLLIFDPTDEVTPVGLIRAQLQGAYGNLADGAQSQVLEMPVLAPDSAGVQRTGKFVLGADGSLAGDISESFTGDDAGRQREMLREEVAKDVERMMETGLGAQLPGLNFKSYAFHNAANLDRPLDLDLHFNVDNYARSSGPLLLLRPLVTGSLARQVPGVMAGKPRDFAIELGHPGRWRDNFDIALPAGYTLDEAPDPVNVDVGFASYSAKVTAQGNMLHYQREYVVRQVEIPPAKAADFRHLEGAILEDEQGMVVLKKQ